MHGMVNIAVRAARRAGELMIRQLNRLESLEITEKNRNEYVTEVDRIAEDAIIEVIYDHYPDHSILAEESGQGQQRVPVDYRSARWHHQLHPWLSGLRRLNCRHPQRST